jgi:hypothetical protein
MGKIWQPCLKLSYCNTEMHFSAIHYMILFWLIDSMLITNHFAEKTRRGRN